MDRREIMNATGCGTEIADDAASHGLIPRLLATSASMRLYEVGDTQVIDTTGGAVWADQVDHDEWCELLSYFS